MPQIALQKVIQVGIRDLKDNPDQLDDIFNYMTEEDIENDYGDQYIDKVKQWFLTTKVPVLHAWSFNADRIPCISIHLANEAEDENKAGIGDYFGDGSDGEIGISVFSVQLDIGIHASKDADKVLWLYYIISYILFKHKRYAEKLGLQLQTFSASDWDKRPEYMTENIWTRWIRFKCVTQNSWDSEPFTEPDSINLELEVEQIEISYDD
jgi:hypothetical protein